jgi:hypothetical protein
VVLNSGMTQKQLRHLRCAPKPRVSRSGACREGVTLGSETSISFQPQRGLHMRCGTPVGFVGDYLGRIPSVRPSTSSGRRWALELRTFGVMSLAAASDNHAEKMIAITGSESRALPQPTAPRTRMPARLAARCGRGGAACSLSPRALMVGKLMPLDDEIQAFCASLRQSEALAKPVAPRRKRRQ